jgi:hypothetical protein
MSAWFVACQLSGYPAADKIVGATEYAETCFSTIDMPWAHVVGGQVAGGQGWSIAGRSVSGVQGLATPAPVVTTRALMFRRVVLEQCVVELRADDDGHGDEVVEE